MTSAPSFAGVRIDAGPQPFQIVQRDGAGHGTFALSGRWYHPDNRGRIQLRVVREHDATEAVTWSDFEARPDGTWSADLTHVPTGGLYRIESRLAEPQGVASEWSTHGDFIHHLGVGDLWIIAGQSNAAGYGRGPVLDPPRLGVHVLRNDETWDIATQVLNETTRSSHPNLEGGNPGHSPYLAFGKALHDELGYPIGLIQTSLGGSPLKAWNPVESPGGAPLWDNLLHCLHLSGNAATGMVWYQGESDANPDHAFTYERRFEEFVTAIRTHLGRPDLAVIVAQLNRCVTAAADDNANFHWTVLREAQRRATKLGHTAVVPTLDLPLSDLIHTSSDGNLTLGRRKARAALEVAYGRSVGAWRGANLVKAHLSSDRTVIELSFEDVSSHIGSLGPIETDFVVEDETGPVTVTGGSLPDRHLVKLELGRAVHGRGRIHGHYGTHTVANVRDAEHNLPFLGFYGVELA